MHTSGTGPDRRRFLSRLIATIHAVIAATLGLVLGGAVTSSSRDRAERTWLPAFPLRQLPLDQPTLVTVRVARQDGYAQVIDRYTIFLVRSGDDTVFALDSTCTHLGCRVRWSVAEQELRCPCHGGAYDRTGAVRAGPPPTALARIPVQVTDDQVLVQI